MQTKKNPLLFEQADILLHAVNLKRIDTWSNNGTIPTIWFCGIYEKCLGPQNSRIRRISNVGVNMITKITLLKNTNDYLFKVHVHVSLIGIVSGYIRKHTYHIPRTISSSMIVFQKVPSLDCWINNCDCLLSTPKVFKVVKWFQKIPFEDTFFELYWQAVMMLWWVMVMIEVETSHSDVRTCYTATHIFLRTLYLPATATAIN